VFPSARNSSAMVIGLGVLILGSMQATATDSQWHLS
jgi:hypothetical protein